MSQSKTVTPESRTDTQYQHVTAFIEGVEVPFISISVNSALEQLPQASLSVPPQVGLMEISRFYNPKVHIFFTDPIDNDEKLLFSGIITSSNMTKTAEGSSAITFTCVHRYQFLNELLVDFSDWTSERTNPQAGSEQAVKSYALSSKYAIGLALTGVFRDPNAVSSYREVSAENIADDRKNNKNTTSPSVMPAYLIDYKNRLLGTPSILLNLWQQLKQGAYWTSEVNEIMIKLYIPLIEDGLQFFKRIAGHFYIEDKIEEDRIDPCPEVPSPEAGNKPRLVPPCARLFLRSSLQADIGSDLVHSNIQFSGEMTDMMTIYSRFLSSIDYEMLFLTSPAEVLLDPIMDNAGVFTAQERGTYAVDFIVKPQMPFYFSPRCNVLYPGMIRSVTVNQDDYSIPTRITLRNSNKAIDQLDQFYRAPASIREAIANFAGVTKKIIRADTTTNLVKPGTRQAVNVSYTITNATAVDTPHQNLQATLAGSHNKVGKYEQGRGIKAEKILMPAWLSFFSQTQFRDIKGDEGWPDPDTDPFNYDAIQQLNDGWIKRYGKEKTALNPWSKSSGLKGYQRLLVASADYSYAMATARSRSGTAELIFNPYIVPGYPMDMLDSTPNHPSFHAYCTSVSHNITPNSISTSVGFASAMTYTELANYYLPSVHPWLQYVLGLARSQSLVDYQPGATVDDESTTVPFGQEDPLSPSARAIADRFYVSTLGTGCAAPADLYSFDTGEIKPVVRVDYGLAPGSSDAKRGTNQGDLNPMLTGVGNLDLAYRPIETKTNITERWDIKFIDLIPGNYNPQVVRIKNEKLADKDALEPGQSQWLNYDPIFEDDSIV